MRALRGLAPSLLVSLGAFVPLYALATWVLRSLTHPLRAPLGLWWHWASRGLLWATPGVALGLTLGLWLAHPRLAAWGAVRPARAALVGALAAVLAAAGWTWLFPHLPTWVDPAATTGPALLRALERARWWASAANVLAGAGAVGLVYLPWLLVAPERNRAPMAPADV